MTRGDLAEDDRAHDAGAAGDELAPDAADDLARSVEARDRRAVLVEHLHVLVGGDAAQGHDAQRVQRHGVVRIALDLVDSQVVGGLRAIIQAAELVGAARLHRGVVGLDGRREVLRGHADLLGQLPYGARRHLHMRAGLAFLGEVGVIEVRAVRRTQVLEDLVGEDVILHGARLLLQRDLAHGGVRLGLVAEALALLVDDDAAGLPGIGVGDGAGLGVVLALQAHREGRDGAHGSLVERAAHLLHEQQAVAVGAGRAAGQVLLAVGHILRHQLAVGGVAAGADDDRLAGGVGDLAVGALGHDSEHLTLVVSHELSRLGVGQHGDALIRIDQGVEHLVRGGLVHRLVVWGRLVGALHGVERVLRREHGAVAGRTVHGIGVVLQAALVEPVEHLGRLIGVQGHQLQAGLAAEVAAVLHDVGDVGLHAILDALFLLDDGARGGHGAAGVVERAAGLGGHLQHDDVRSALIDRLQRSGKSAAARADDHHVRVGLLRGCRHHEAGQQHAKAERQSHEPFHLFSLLYRLSKRTRRAPLRPAACSIIYPQAV